MSTLRGWFNTFTKETPKEYLGSYPAGTTLTIPGQGSDLALIIQSIVKLPPLDERTFDSGSDEELDPNALIVHKEVEDLYPATGANLAETIDAKRKADKASKATTETKSSEAETPTKEEA